MKTLNLSTLAIATLLVLTGCSDGDNGKDGNHGINGKDGVNGATGQSGSHGTNGLNSLVQQTQLTSGNQQCWLGGVKIDSGLDKNNDGQLSSDEVSDTSYVCNPDNFASSGVRLPYSVLRNDLENGNVVGATFEVRNGGYGSDMDSHPTNPMQFYALTDRGPNATFSGTQGKGKIFPTPDYTPRIGLFEVQATGSIKLVKNILLKDKSGNHISGLPNSSALGGTAETPYDVKGEVIRVDMSKPYDKTTNPIRIDDFGLDAEGLVAMNDGTFWVSDEYGPHIVHYSADGTELERINPFSNDTRNLHTLPSEFANRWANRGMEGLTITPDEKTLVGIMQSSLDNPSKNRTDLTRIVTVNIATGETAQYLYRQEQGANSNSAIKALSNTQFLVLERDGKFYHRDNSAMKRVYKIDISNATNLETVSANSELVQDHALGLLIAGETLEQVINNRADNGNYSAGWAALEAKGIVPAKKLELVVDMVAEVGYPHDKMEGLWLIDNTRLGVINDDDFATWSTGGVLEQKYLDDAKSIVDGNTLYIINGLNMSAN
ncbi:esterase-like activity of phytase family protein [Pseudoalteromonas sp. S16_S37]|uniref:esterase-like activity of phytase family protein n=1 Tax=Pseudoalteromonas sp. S16_S37 TaxID=2720228 RepID=UPI001680BBF1|nr:esterase-like activity of phytase family protein [Pseudoalteromonas sp. S16_S37]MBD1584303.1 esterase-like activity of phytase family protein [Pseudoalteromonas sp. S16_S37]